MFKKNTKKKRRERSYLQIYWKYLLIATCLFKKIQSRPLKGNFHNPQDTYSELDSTCEGNYRDKKPVLSKGYCMIYNDYHKRSALKCTTNFQRHA